MKFLRFASVLLLVFLLGTPELKAYDPVKVLDCLEREVLIEKQPERIVITGRAGFMVTNASFFFSSAAKKLVTYSKNFQFRDSDSFYRMVDPFFENRTFTDHNTGIEELASLKPDLILAKDFERPRLEKSLAQLGIPVLFFNLESPDVYFKDISNLGVVFSEQGRAQKIITFFRDWQQKIFGSLKSIPAKKQPTVLHLFHSDRGGNISFSVSPAHWIQARLVKDAGGVPVWTEASIGNGWKKIGFDQIAAWDPDYIFVTSYFGNAEKTVEKLKSDPLWQLLSAGKNQQIFAFPEDFICWDQPDSRWILGLCWLTAILNPEICSLKDPMHQLFTEFFQLYGISPERSAGIKVLGDYF